MKPLRFKHVYGETNSSKYEQVNPTTITCESSMIKPNSKYTAFMWQAGGGGILCVVENDKQQKLPMDFPMIKGHTGNILDLDWYPFNDQYIATSSMDNTVKLWHIPDQISVDITESQTTLSGHDKKVNLIQWHPSAAYTLASGSYDSTLKVWDVTKGDAVFTVNAQNQAPLSLEWNLDGSLLGSSWNDKKYRIADPRQEKFTLEHEAHLGTKPQKFTWLGDTGYYVTVGFSRDQQREYSLWDISKPEKPIETKTIDNGSGVMYPVYDDALSMLYVTGKGDSTIRYWEFVDGQLHFLTSYNGQTPGKGYGWYPKRSLNVSRCEIMKAAKLCEKTIEFVSIFAPRRSTQFQEDLFPDCPSAEPALTFEQWQNGQTSKPKTQSMRPDAVNQQQSQSPQKQQQPQFTQKEAQKKVSQDEEIRNLTKRVQELEKELALRDQKILELQGQLQQQ